VRSVFFDVDGVLIHSLFHPEPARRRRWDQHLLEDMGVAPEDLASFFDDRFIDVIEGRRSIIEALDRFLPTTGFRGSSLDFLTYWLTQDTNVNVQLVGVVRALRTSYTKLYLATNQEHVRAFHLWKAVGLRHYFDDMFYAARLGVGKAAREFYGLVDAAIGPQSEPPLFFDDSSRVVRTAAAHGWEAVLYKDLDDCAGHPWVAARLAVSSP
jgi:putative hydrolase of the HAD superfamily